MCTKVSIVSIVNFEHVNADWVHQNEASLMHEWQKFVNTPTQLFVVLAISSIKEPLPFAYFYINIKLNPTQVAHQTLSKVPLTQGWLKFVMVFP